MSKAVPAKTSKRLPVRDAAFTAQNLLSELLADLDTGVAVATAAGGLIYANRRFAELLGIRWRQQFDHLNVKDFVSARSWADFDAALRQGQRETVQGDVSLDVNGETHTVRLTFSPMGGAIGEIRITAAEVTELLETSRALHSSQASVQSLSARILQVEDEERRRIARDLHDNTGQEVVALSMALHRAEAHAGEAGSEARQAIDDALKFASNIEKQIRTLSYLLHPPLLDELGLRAAIDWFIGGFKERSGVAFSVDAPESLPRFTARQETALFRVLQSSLGNVLRHSGSPTAHIRVTATPEQVSLTVEDRGTGMTVDQLEAARRGLSTGVGIGGMRERLRELGGTLEVNSGKGGTQVTATLPITPREEPLPLQFSAPTVAAAPSMELSSGGRKRILIVDDHEVTRQGIKALLEGRPDLEVVGEASDGIEAIAKTAELKPDLIVLDLTMPRLGGLAVANKIRQSDSRARILVFTTHAFSGLTDALRSAGCQGYVLKENASTELADGIVQVLRGAEFYCSQAC